MSFLRRPQTSSWTTALLLGLLALLPFIQYAPNRVSMPESFFLWETGSWIMLVPAAVVLLVLLKDSPGFSRIDLLIPGLITLAALMILSHGENLIPPEVMNTARTGGAPGFWGWILTAYLYGVTSRRPASLVIPVAVLILFLLGGGISYLGPVREFFVKRDRFFIETAAHISLAASATAVAAVLSIPAGIIAHRNGLVSRAAFTGANIIQTLPSLALFGLMIAPLAWLSARFPLLRNMGVKGVGNFPALLALSGYAALPILRNTFTGLNVIPRGAIEAGKGMGMSPFRLLLMVEIPLALPVILAGLRIAFVQAIGNTTVAALIGAGGLGNFVFQGLGQAAPDLILLGVVPLVALAVAADSGLKLVERLVTPKPFREKS